MSDTEHHWVYEDRPDMGPAVIAASPLIVAADGSVEGVLSGLTLITKLDGLKERAWTITWVDSIEYPTDHRIVWAAEGHGSRDVLAAKGDTP
jgi:hypothetical protein